MLLEVFASLSNSVNNANCNVSVLLLINYKGSDSELVKKMSKDLYNKMKAYQGQLDLHTYLVEMPDKKGGVGMARKLLMDAAFIYYFKQGSNGIIVNLDADSTVSANYVFEILAHFNKHSNIDAASLSFHHRFEDLESRQRNATINYELHLRYFINMQRWIGLPYAYQTIGSAMACKSNAYAKVGGMPMRQAGEDFYFIHKFTKLHTLSDLQSAIVYPSGRISDRVPFGTGKAVGDMMERNKLATSYNPQAFIMLKSWLAKLVENYPDFNRRNIECEEKRFNDFLYEFDIYSLIEECKSNSSDFDSFFKRFFQSFDAFKLMKYLHYIRDKGYQDLAIQECVSFFFTLIKLPCPSSSEEQLLALREYDSHSKYQWSADLISRESSISDSFSTHQANRE